MSWLIASKAPSYAEEQLTAQLSALSTLPINLTALPSSASASRGQRRSDRTDQLEFALHALGGTKGLSTEELVDVLKGLSKDGTISGFAGSDEERVLEAEVMGRAITMVWKVVLQTYLDEALALEEERSWWDGTLNSRRGVPIYLIQTLPHRLYRAISPHIHSITLNSLQTFKWPSRSALFRPVPNASEALTAITSPYILTRREMLSSRKALQEARDAAAKRIGLLASQGPSWAGASSTDLTRLAASSHNDGVGEGERVYGVMCQVLDIPAGLSSSSQGSSRRRSATITPAPSGFTATPTALLSILSTHLPKARANLEKTRIVHQRPSPLTRLWFPLLFLPPAVWTASRTFMRNKQWMKEQILNAKETIRGFAVTWVWEPLEGIGKTLRGGGEGLGVAPTTVKADQDSLERMVMDLGRDYYHLSGPALDALGEKVKEGDMTEVLRVYEKEMQSPLKNALMGSLVRTILIQVQKTKTDVSLSLLSLDHLLRSQQLTFAFVGVAPSVLVLYGLGGYLRGVWRGEKRGKGRKRRYFNGLRDVERLLLVAPKHDQEMSDRDRGLLIVGVSGLRSWAAGLGSSHRGAFLDDLRMVENPSLTRGDKLRVVERIWRCWGVDGKSKA